MVLESQVANIVISKKINLGIFSARQVNAGSGEAGLRECLDLC